MTGRRDFDFVTMDDYAADMKETADRDAGAVIAIKRERDAARKMLLAVVRSVGGSVSVKTHLLEDARMDRWALETDLELSSMEWRLSAQEQDQ